MFSAGWKGRRPGSPIKERPQRYLGRNTLGRWEEEKKERRRRKNRRSKKKKDAGGAVVEEALMEQLMATLAGLSPE